MKTEADLINQTVNQPAKKKVEPPEPSAEQLAMAVVDPAPGGAQGLAVSPAVVTALQKKVGNRSVARLLGYRYPRGAKGELRRLGKLTREVAPDASAWDRDPARTIGSLGGESTVGVAQTMGKRQFLAKFAPSVDRPDPKRLQLAAKAYDDDPTTAPAVMERLGRFGYNPAYASWASSQSASHAAAMADMRRAIAEESHAQELEQAKKELQEASDALKDHKYKLGGGGGKGQRERKTAATNRQTDAKKDLALLLERGSQLDPSVEATRQQDDERAMDQALGQMATHLDLHAAQHLVTTLGTARTLSVVHGLGAEAVGVLTSAFEPAKVEAVASAFPQGLPSALSGTEGSGRLRRLLDAGVDPARLAGAIKGIGPGFDPLLSEVPQCTRLLGEVDLQAVTKCLKTVPAAKLLPAIDLLPAPHLAACLTAIQPTALVALLQGPGGEAGVADLVTLSDPKSLGTLTQEPELAPLCTLLGRTDRQAIVSKILPNRKEISLAELIGLLTTRVAAGELGAMLAATAGLGKKAADVKAYVSDPANARRLTGAAYKESVLRQLGEKATAEPTALGQKKAPSGATYMDYKHLATIDDKTLQILIGHGWVKATRLSDPFKSETESAEGGDTREYEIEIFDGTRWNRRWVAHAHREKGQAWNKTSVNHLKHWEQRKLKVATRITISTDTMGKVRDLARDTNT